MAQIVPSAPRRPADGTVPVLELSGVLNLNGNLLTVAIGDSVPLQINDRLSTSPGVHLLLDFGNGEYLVLNGNSEVQIIAIQPLRISIARGQVLLAGAYVTADAEVSAFHVKGADAAVELTFEPGTGNLWVDCLNGECTFSNGSMLNAGQRSGREAGLPTGEPVLANYDDWLALAPNLVPLPTSAPTSTSTFTPTVTPTPTNTPGQ